MDIKNLDMRYRLFSTEEEVDTFDLADIEIATWAHRSVTNEMRDLNTQRIINEMMQSLQVDAMLGGHQTREFISAEHAASLQLERFKEHGVIADFDIKSIEYDRNGRETSMEIEVALPMPEKIFVSVDLNA